MVEFPQIDDDGEVYSFENIWREISPQEITGADCFQSTVDLHPTDNLITLRLTALEFTKMFSSLYNGAELTYPDEFMQIMVNFLKGLHCPPEVIEDMCQEFPPFASFINYTPMNPFIDPDEIPEGYLTQPFTILDADDALELGYEEGDIIVPFGSITLDGDWFDTLDGQLPTITVDVNGAGTVVLKLLSVLQGGLVVITVDEPPNLLDIIIGVVTGGDNIVDLNKDNLSVPPETADEIDIPVKVVGEGVHTVYVIYIPILDDSLIPLRFGGGFRGVELCDFVEGFVDCEQLEDCLGDSPTIESIENNITVLNAGQEALESAMQQDAEDCGCGGNVYPPPQENYDEEGADETSSFVCGAASYAATQIVEQVTAAYDNSSDVSGLQTFLISLIGLGGGVNVGLMRVLWDFLHAGVDGSFIDNLQDAESAIAEAFFCNLLDIDAAKAAIEANTEIDAEVREAVSKMIDATLRAQFELWFFIGGETVSADCSGMCDEHITVWEFKEGSYTPIGGETIITGDTWNATNATFDSSRGYYGSSANIWTITKDLPPDIQLIQQFVLAARADTGLSVQAGVWWKGVTGSGALEISPLITVTEPPPDGTEVQFDLHNAKLDALLGYMDNAGSGTPFDSEIHYIYIVSKGARPSS